MPIVSNSNAANNGSGYLIVINIVARNFPHRAQDHTAESYNVVRQSEENLENNRGARARDYAGIHLVMVGSLRLGMFKGRESNSMPVSNMISS